MKIIDYSDIQALTCDTTFITCDSTVITCDMVALAGQIEFIIIPRQMVNTVFVTLYNELTFVETTFIANAQAAGRYMKFFAELVNIKEADSFELTVRKDSFTGEILYRDKAYATTNKDLENYKLNYPRSNGVIIVN